MKLESNIVFGEPFSVMMFNTSISRGKPRNHIALHAALYWAIYFPLHVKVDMVSCFRLAHKIDPLFMIKTYSAVDREWEILSAYELLL